MFFSVDKLLWLGKPEQEIALFSKLEFFNAVELTNVSLQRTIFVVLQ